MATAEELLTTAAIEDDGVLVVDYSSRLILIPESVTNLGVESDDGVLRLPFRMKRYYCGYDLTEFTIGINFFNVHGSGDRDPVKDIRVIDNTIEFVWEVGRNAASYRGNVNFNICAKKYNGSIVTKEFNTTPATLPILEGLETSERIVAEYNDVLEEWRLRLFELSDVGVNNVTDATAAAKVEIAEAGDIQVARAEAASQEAVDAKDYVNQIVAGNEAYTKYQTDRKYAPSVIETASGESIIAEDSSDAPLHGLRVFGKSTQVKTTGAQMLQLNDHVTIDRGLTVTIINGVVTVKGIAASTSGFNLTLAGTYASTDTIFVLPAGTYTLTDCMISNFDGVNRVSYFNKTVTLEEDFNVTWVASRSYGKTEIVNEVTYPMINAGDTALPWEPYTGEKPSPSPDYPQEITSAGNRRNYFNLAATSEVNNGVTFTVNGDGSVTANGTSTTTDPIRYTLGSVTLEPGEYLVSGQKETNNTTFIMFSDQNGSFLQQYSDQDVELIITEEAAISVYLVILESATVSNITVYPMIRPRSIVDNTFHLYDNGKKEISVSITGKNLVDLSDLEFDDSNYVHMYYPTNKSARNLYSFLRQHIGETVILSMKTTGVMSGVDIGSIRYYDQGDKLLCAIIPGYPHVILDLPDTYTACYVYGSTSGASISELQLEFGDTVTDYEPYVERQCAVTPTENGLYGLPVEVGGNVVDSNGQRYTANYRDWERGVDVQCVDVKTINGDLYFEEAATQIAGTYTAFVRIRTIWINPSNSFLCDKLRGYPSAGYKTSAEEGIYSNTGPGSCDLIILRISNARGVTDMSSLKAYLAANPLKVYAPLKTPVETPIPEAELAEYRALRTNYPVTTVTTNAGVVTEISYGADTKNFIKKYIKELTGGE